MQVEEGKKNTRNKLIRDNQLFITVFYYFAFVS